MVSKENKYIYMSLYAFQNTRSKFNTVKLELQTQFSPLNGLHRCCFALGWDVMSMIFDEHEDKNDLGGALYRVYDMLWNTTHNSALPWKTIVNHSISNIFTHTTQLDKNVWLNALCRSTVLVVISKYLTCYEMRLLATTCKQFSMACKRIWSLFLLTFPVKYRHYRFKCGKLKNTLKN